MVNKLFRIVRFVERHNDRNPDNYQVKFNIFPPGIELRHLPTKTAIKINL